MKDMLKVRGFGVWDTSGSWLNFNPKLATGGAIPGPRRKGRGITYSGRCQMPGARALDSTPLEDGKNLLLFVAASAALQSDTLIMIAGIGFILYRPARNAR